MNTAPATRVLLVAAGGTLGTAARLALGFVNPDAAGLPLSILVANVAGSFLLGVLAARLPAASGVRLFLGTGVLGGFTTYSAFTVGIIELGSAAPWLAAGYAVVSVAIGIGAAVLGLWLGRWRQAPGGGAA